MKIYDQTILLTLFVSIWNGDKIGTLETGLVSQLEWASKVLTTISIMISKHPKQALNRFDCTNWAFQSKSTMLGAMV